VDGHAGDDARAAEQLLGQRLLRQVVHAHLQARQLMNMNESFE
jgi:hypothetical protein